MPLQYGSLFLCCSPPASPPADEALPERGFLGTDGAVAHLVEVLFVGPPVVHHLVDGAPVGQAAEVAVVDEEVGVELAAVGCRFARVLAGVVAVDGVEFEAALAAVFDGFVEEVALAHAPQDEQVAFGLQFFQGCDGEGDFLAYVGVFVLDDGPVEVYGDGHVGRFCLYVGRKVSNFCPLGRRGARFPRLARQKRP